MTTTGGVWRAVPGLRKYLEVTSDGRVRAKARIVRTKKGQVRHRSMHELIPQRIGQTHSVSLTIDGRQRMFTVSRLVASAWVGYLNRSLQVVHLNGDVADDRAENLKIVPSNEAPRYRTSTSRASRSASNIRMRRGEVWRNIPGSDVTAISNFARAISRATQPPILLTVQTPKQQRPQITVMQYGRRTNRTVASLMRETWPELAHEWPDKRSQRPNKAFQNGETKAVVPKAKKGKDDEQIAADITVGTKPQVIGNAADCQN